MTSALALAAEKKAEQQTVHGRINQLFSALSVLRRLDRGVWYFQITQEFTLPPSARVKRGSHHLFWLMFA
jgi:hypothetical protein